MDLGGWLRSLGLEQYEATFRDNAINEKVLPNLTAEDLKDMGVGIVGHRRMLLDAIALLRADGSAKAPPAEASSTTPKPAQDTAERRQVTVMFSDLVGSTALAGRMDPEDLREIISAYQKCVAETVRRFGGFVAKYMGDGVLVYFGYPQAHEDDAERSVRSGLELIQAVGGLKSSAPLQTRVGIGTGLVVVGDLIGSGAAQEQAVVGETPNLAARLQGIAEPNTVVIAESTRKLLGNLFDLNDLGAQDLKGIGGRVRTPGPRLRPGSAEGRFEALHASGLTAACRSGRRTRTPASALVKGKDRPRSGGACSQARPGSANRGLRRRCWKASRGSRLRAFATFARRTIRTARSTRSSSSSNAPPDWRATTRLIRSSGSCGDCSRPVRAGMMKSSYWPSCYHCQVPPLISI